MSGENTLEFIIYIAIKNTEARYQIECLKTKGCLIFPVHARGKNGLMKNHLTGEKYIYINITHSRGAPLKVQIKFLFL